MKEPLPPPPPVMRAEHHGSADSTSILPPGDREFIMQRLAAVQNALTEEIARATADLPDLRQRLDAVERTLTEIRSDRVATDELKVEVKRLLDDTRALIGRDVDQKLAEAAGAHAGAQRGTLWGGLTGLVVALAIALVKACSERIP